MARYTHSALCFSLNTLFFFIHDLNGQNINIVILDSCKVKKIDDNIITDILQNWKSKKQQKH